MARSFLPAFIFVVGWGFTGVCFGSTVTGDLNTVDSTVDSNNATTTNNYNGAGSGKSVPVPSANSPSYMGQNNDSCLRGISGGVQLLSIGISGGHMEQDPLCNRRKNAKMLKDLGMSIAATRLACEDNQIFLSMAQSGTPCPLVINGKLKVGKAAYLAMKMQPYKLIPEYEQNKEVWDTILGIGVEQTNEETNTDNRSISERFRSSRTND